AFYYQDYERQKGPPSDRYLPVGPGVFQVRFTPRESGEYRWRLQARYRNLLAPSMPPETAESAAYAFTVTPRSHRGFVRVSPRDPRYFEYEDGSPCFPVGHNFRSPTDLTDWIQLLLPQNPGTPPPVDRGLNIYEEYLPRMAAVGENMFEVWMSSWWLAIEWSDAWKGYHGLGCYNTENAWKLDELLRLAEENGFQVHLALDNHGKAAQGVGTGPGRSGQVDHEWEFSPYNVANGGFLTDPLGLFRDDPRVTRYYHNLLRYVAGRWGYSTAIFGIEMWSEIDLIGSKDGRDKAVYASPEVRAWHQRMIRYLKSLDHGRHVVTTHYSYKYNVIDRDMVALPEIDYITCDAYHTMGQSLVQLLLNTDRFAQEFHKPYLVTEYGASWNAGTWEVLEADLHAGLWTSWMTNASGTALFWWFEHLNRADLYPHFRGLARFLRGEDKRSAPEGPPFEAWPVEIRGMGDKPPGALASLAQGNGEVVYAWIYDEAAVASLPSPDKRRPHTRVVAVFRNLKGRTANVEVWDTLAGEILSSLSLGIEGSAVSVSLPDFWLDVAIKIRTVP
ncbi:MAG: glycoside hydrolase family 2 TIM barrel-domain containing protein, partial [Planctomycetota bacterium]